MATEASSDLRHHILERCSCLLALHSTIRSGTLLSCHPEPQLHRRVPILKGRRRKSEQPDAWGEIQGAEQAEGNLRQRRGVIEANVEGGGTSSSASFSIPHLDGQGSGFEPLGS